MNTKHTLLSALLLIALIFSCKDKETVIEERIEENHPTKEDAIENPEEDSTIILKDSVIDSNMKDQNDTHGRDTDAGR